MEELLAELKEAKEDIEYQLEQLSYYFDNMCSIIKELESEIKGEI